MVEEFYKEVTEAARQFTWIKRIDSRIVGKVMRARLWLNDEFVDVYYNAQTGTTSFAYIEKGERVYGANNMRIGWHLHPFGETNLHEVSSPFSIFDFLRSLEKELRRRGRID